MKILNTNYFVPIYFTIKQELHNKIITGILKADEKIPSEDNLAQSYKTSRMTARRAVSELVNEGYLYRVHGKGTFVSKPRLEKSFSKLTGFMEDMRARGFSVSSKVIETDHFLATDELQETLNLTENKNVYKVDRLRFANNEPILFQSAYLPVEKCPELINHDLENNSLYEILADKYNIFVHHGRQSVEAISANDRIANLFEIKIGSPILSMKRVTFTEDDSPIEYVTSYFRGDRYILEVELIKNND